MRLQTDCEIVFFASSSGHCTFDCHYCIVNPIAKRQASLNYEDFQFLLDFFGKKSFFSLSGAGDFFASYSKSERLLEKLLSHDVEVALDTNGSILQEFSELSPDAVDKIRYINLTMHYHQLKEKKLLKVWARNAALLLGKIKGVLMLDYIMSPPLMGEWEEALAYYEETVFAATDKKILLVRDIQRPFEPSVEEALQSLREKFQYLVEDTHQEDFAAIFAGRETVFCPAGQSYFRIWNDGRLQGCPNLPGVPGLSECGNVKERRITPRAELFPCATPHYCDCHVIEALGKMQYEPPRDSASAQSVSIPAA